MDTRQKELSELHLYVEEVDKELTMILQSLQWDRKHLLEGKEMATCKYNTQHRMPYSKKEEHEKQCFLKCQGYTEEDKLLPDPVDATMNNLVTLNKDDIEQIIEKASKNDPTFKRGCQDSQPLTLDRLQVSYTADERRAIHDAVVNAVPSCHDLSDLVLSNGEEQKTKVKSRLEILAELRDMKRRRTKYRVAAKTRNYSDVLRDVIKIQMEHYTESQDKTSIATTTENVNRDFENNHSNHKAVSDKKYFHKEEKHTEDKRKKHRDDSKDIYRDVNTRDKRSSEERDRRTKYYKDERDKYRDRSKHRNDEYRSKYDQEYSPNSINSKSKHTNANPFKDKSRYEEKRHENRNERSHKEEREPSSSSKYKDTKYTRYYDNFDLESDRERTEGKRRKKY